MLERLQSRHAGPVAPIHETSWSPHELSVAPGRPCPELFYGSAAPLQNGFWRVYTEVGRVDCPDKRVVVFEKDFGREGAAGAAPS